MPKTIDMSAFRHLYPFKSRFMHLDGGRYHYLDEGRGQSVAMIHGNPTWSFYFRSLVRALSPDYRVIVPDHIGCGLSDKPSRRRYGYRLQDRVNDLEALFDHLDLKRKITLVVHDWGGIIAMGYAIRYPERISRMVLMNTAAFFPPGDKLLPFRLQIIRNLRLFAIPAVLGLNLFSRAALYLATGKGLARDVRAGLTAPYNCWQNRIATLKFVQDIPVRPGDPSYDLVKSIDENLYRLAHIPVLLLWGAKDFVFDRAYLVEWQRRFPGAETHLFEGAGHYVLEDEPHKIIVQVRRFLKHHAL